MIQSERGLLAALILTTQHGRHSFKRTRARSGASPRTDRQSGRARRLSQQRPPPPAPGRQQTSRTRSTTIRAGRGRAIANGGIVISKRGDRACWLLVGSKGAGGAGGGGRMMMTRQILYHGRVKK